MRSLVGYVAIGLVLVGAACGDDSQTSSADGANCNCANGAYVPVCGVDGMTYDATCGTSCVAVDIACDGACPCAQTDAGDASNSGTSGSASDGTQGSAESPMSADASGDSASSTTDPCDCVAGAAFPVCGVDGMTYDATCGLQCVPVEVACLLECPCSPLSCGAMVCEPGQTVCTTISPGAPGDDPMYECDVVPPACTAGVPTCDCVAPRACQCEQDEQGYFNVTCAGS